MDWILADSSGQEASTRGTARGIPADRSLGSWMNCSGAAIGLRYFLFEEVARWS